MSSRRGARAHPARQPLLARHFDDSFYGTDPAIKPCYQELAAEL
jgi:hypothetical protein